MLVSPCASVSWISPASRWRSESVPACRLTSASSACAASRRSISCARSLLCSMIRTIQVPSTSEKARPSATVPNTNAIALELCRSDPTASTTGVTFSAMTPANARGSDTAMKHSGQAPNSTQELAPTWICATTTRATMQSTKTVPRSVSRSAAMAGRPTARYSGTVAARDAAATTRAASGP